MKNETIDISSFYFAVSEGVDEQGNPIYGEPKKLFDKRENEEEI
ncbi:hypothetical protein [Psychrobacillus sp.]|nr:hypothetical protein [Psychrobacillus sp.]